MELTGQILNTNKINVIPNFNNLKEALANALENVSWTRVAGGDCAGCVDDYTSELVLYKDQEIQFVVDCYEWQIRVLHYTGLKNMYYGEFHDKKILNSPLHFKTRSLVKEMKIRWRKENPIPKQIKTIRR